MSVQQSAKDSVEQYKRKHEPRGCFWLPPKPLPKGRYLVHNFVTPTRNGLRPGALGGNGFRAWTQKGRDNLVECHCDFGGCKNAEVQKHYRVR